jgi:hypothetical protein
MRKLQDSKDIVLFVMATQLTRFTNDAIGNG